MRDLCACVRQCTITLLSEAIAVINGMNLLFSQDASVDTKIGAFQKLLLVINLGRTDLVRFPILEEIDVARVRNLCIRHRFTIQINRKTELFIQNQGHVMPPFARNLSGGVRNFFFFTSIVKSSLERSVRFYFEIL